MKKYIFAIAAAAVALSSCDKGTGLEPEGTSGEVSLNAYAATRAVINSDWSEDWEEGDGLTVFNAEAGTAAYSSRCHFRLSGEPAKCKFVKDSASVVVTGKSAYDWYVCYPWLEYASAPDGTKGYTIPATYKQFGYSTLSTVDDWDIMAGVAENVADGTAPTVTLHHTCAILKFTVVNNSKSATPITSLKFDATECGTYTNGSFSMVWKPTPALDPTRMGSLKSYVTTVNVVNSAEDPTAISQTVGVGESVDIYVITAPFTLASGASVKLSVYGGNGEVSVTKTMDKSVTFAAGTYSTATIDYKDPEKVLFFDDLSVNTASNKTNLVVYGTTADRDGVAVTLSNGSAYSGSTNEDLTGTAFAGGCWKLSGAKTTSNVKYTGVHVYGATRIRVSFDTMKTCDTDVTLNFNYKKTGGSWISKDINQAKTSSTPTKGVVTKVSYDIDVPSGAETIEFYVGANPTGTYPYFDNIRIVDISE